MSERRSKLTSRIASAFSFFEKDRGKEEEDRGKKKERKWKEKEKKRSFLPKEKKKKKKKKRKKKKEKTLLTIPESMRKQITPTLQMSALCPYLPRRTSGAR